MKKILTLFLSRWSIRSADFVVIYVVLQAEYDGVIFEPVLSLLVGIF